jgi:two-component system nitrate/nitrite response regulator NarL
MGKQMKLLLADDHVLFREAIIQFIVALRPEWTIIATSDFESAYTLLNKDEKFDLVLLDLRMPGMHGLKGLEKIINNHPDQYVSILSGVAEEHHIKEAMKKGARAYLPKTLSGKSIVKAIELVVLSNQKFVPMDETGIKIMPSYYDDYDMFSPAEDENSDKAVNPIDSLTKREKEVLSHLAAGLSNKDIAHKIGVQIATVKLHVSGVCKKMKVANRTQAAVMAHKLGLSSQEA